MTMAYYSSSSVTPSTWEASHQFKSDDSMGSIALCNTPDLGTIVVSLSSLSAYVAYTCPIKGEWETTLPYYSFAGSVHVMEAGEQTLFPPSWMLLNRGVDWWYVYTTHFFAMIESWQTQGWNVILED
jgi:hypothetical protein